MAAEDHLSEQQFLYHVSPRKNRESISKHGLLAEKSGGTTFLAVEPLSDPGHDAWEVNPHGLNIRAMEGEEGEGTYLSDEDIPPHHLKRLWYNAP